MNQNTVPRAASSACYAFFSSNTNNTLHTLVNYNPFHYGEAVYEARVNEWTVREDACIGTCVCVRVSSACGEKKSIDIRPTDKPVCCN